MAGFGVRPRPGASWSATAWTGASSATTWPAASAAALLDRLLELDWIRRAEASRAVRITDAGRAGAEDYVRGRAELRRIL